MTYDKETKLLTIKISNLIWIVFGVILLTVYGEPMIDGFIDGITSGLAAFSNS